jgi:hypothetical protein
MILLSAGGWMNPKVRALVILGVIFFAAVSLYFLMQDGPGPCRKIRTACEQKGFQFGSTPQERREFMESCFRPLVRGENVAGISVDQDDVTACKERQSRRRRRTGNRQVEKQGDTRDDAAETEDKD